MTRADLDTWESELGSVFARMRPLFYRAESRRHAEQYVRGLLAPIQRKNGWTIAEYVGEPEPAALQRLLNLSPWDADALLDLNREYAMEHLASPAAILVADPTGFAKKGTKSVGVQRQYSGTLGRIDHCQIATFLAYVTPGRDRVLLDRRLYLPKESWVGDPARCAQAGVPPEVTFKTRPAQVREMIESALGAGVPFAWFTADEEFGQHPGLCDYLEMSRIPYVMAVPKTTQFTDATGKKVHVGALAARLPPHAWQRRSCGIGSKGFRVDDWALIDSDHPGHQYLIRRSIDDSELAFYHCHNPHHAGFGALVGVAGARWPIEECFGSGKNEAGLDHYQVPHLGRLAPAYHPRHPRPHLPLHHRTHHQKKGRQQTEQLNNPPGKPTESETAPPIHRRLIALTLAEIRRLLNLIHHGEHAITPGLHWSTWRRRHQAQARRAHVRRHLRLQTLMI